MTKLKKHKKKGLNQKMSNEAKEQAPAKQEITVEQINSIVTGRQFGCYKAIESAQAILKMYHDSVSEVIVELSNKDRKLKETEIKLKTANDKNAENDKKIQELSEEIKRVEWKLKVASDEISELNEKYQEQKSKTDSSVEK